MFFFCLSDRDGVGGVCRLGPNGAPPAGANWLQSGTCLHLAAQRPQDVQEVTPELHPHEGVQDGIEAAVEVTHRGGDYLGFLQRRPDPTGVAAVAGVECIHHECDVVWRPAEEENQHHGHDHPERFLLLEALGAAPQPLQDAGVAEDQDDGRQQEAHRVVEQAWCQSPVTYRPGGKPVVVANTLYSLSSDTLHSLQKDPVGDREDQREEPDCQAAHMNHPGLPAGVHLGRMDDGQVAVQTDAGQQEDPTVEVDRENSSGDLTEGRAKGPSIISSGLCSPEGQRHQQQDICHSQVKDEGVCHTPGPPALNQDSQQHSVSEDPHNKRHGVQNWDEQRLKTHTLHQVAYLVTTVLIIGGIVV